MKRFIIDQQQSFLDRPHYQQDFHKSLLAFSEKLRAEAEEQRPAGPMEWKNPGQAVWVPEGYEPNYSYPLIIWLHDDGEDETQLYDIIPAISDRNYVGLSFQGTFPVTKGDQVGYEWSLSEHHRGQILEEIHASTCQLRSELHIHSERIFLAGRGSSSALAMSLILERPEWFAGALIDEPIIPQLERPLAQFRKLKHLRILMQTQAESPIESLETFCQTLLAAGIDLVRPEVSKDINSTWERTINQFIQEGIARERCQV